MDETKLATRGQDNSYLMPALSVQEAIQRYQAMTKFVQEILKDNIDYGTIPGTNKPTLLKPGAEKLTTFFGLTVRFETVTAEEDWTGANHNGEPFFYYHFRCQLWRGDVLVAEADGSCNSLESKYRWRWVNEEDLPPGTKKDNLKKRGGSLVEFVFAVDKAETAGQYGKPLEYWQQFKDAIDNGTARPTRRKTRAGKEYDAWEIDATVYRVPNEDIYSQVNTVQKMAQKRALVAATLLGVNASEFFTQDIEDLDVSDYIDAQYTVIRPDNGGGKPPAPQREQKQPERPRPTNGNARPFNAATVRDKVRQLAGWQNNERWLDGEPLTDETDGAAANLLWAACKPAQGIATKEEVANRVTLILRYLLGVDDMAQLYEKEAAAIIHWLANAEGTDLNNYAGTEAAVVYGAAMAESDDAEAPF